VKRDDQLVRFLNNALRGADALPESFDRRALRALASQIAALILPEIAALLREGSATPAERPEFLPLMRETQAPARTTTPRVAPSEPAIKEVVRETPDMRARVADDRTARAPRVPDVPTASTEVTPSAQPTPWALDLQRDALGLLRAVVARRNAEVWTFTLVRNALDRVQSITASASDGRSAEFVVERNALDRIARLLARMPDGAWTLEPQRAGGKVAAVRVTRPDGRTHTQEVASVGV